MLSKFLVFAPFILAMIMPGCESCDSSMPLSPTSISAENKSPTANPISEAKETMGEILGNGQPTEAPKVINGVELMSIHGWWANIYPWDYIPEKSAVHPVSRLWTPYQKPSPFQMMEQCRQIKDFGGGAVVLEYSPNQNLDWHNYWLSNDFVNGCGSFFLLYEHINGTRFIPANDGPKDMNNPYNRKVFKDDIDFIFKNVIVPYQSRYITMNGRAVIYMWSSVQMTGDFASLLLEAKDKYPVFFIGSEGMLGLPKRPEDLERVKALDGFMEYSLGGPANYMKAVQDYRAGSYKWRQLLRNIEVETGKKHLLIPTFQAAYDDTKVPGRTNPAMYPRSLEEMEYHARLIKDAMGTVYDRVGPFVVYELPEGAAVIESQCTPETVNRRGRYTGCGLGRLEVLSKFFGRGAW